MMRRRRVLVGGAALLAGTALRPAHAQASADYAVFAELSPQSKLLKGTWNTRVFTDVEARQGGSIQCDLATGIVSVAPGTYRISGTSVVGYYSGGEPPEMTTVRAPSSAGYARLRTVGDPPILDPGLRDIANDSPSVFCVGTPSTANLAGSVVDTIFRTTVPVRFVLEHQVGSNPEQVYLRVYAENSKWHAMARLTILKLA